MASRGGRHACRPARAYWAARRVRSCQGRASERAAISSCTNRLSRPWGCARAPGRQLWVALLRKVFSVDVTVCVRCGGRVRVSRSPPRRRRVARALARAGRRPSHLPRRPRWALLSSELRSAAMGCSDMTNDMIISSPAQTGVSARGRATAQRRKVQVKRGSLRRFAHERDQAAVILHDAVHHR
jgi:hypothetical protein